MSSIPSAFDPLGTSNRWIEVPYIQPLYDSRGNLIREATTKTTLLNQGSDKVGYKAFMDRNSPQAYHQTDAWYFNNQCTELLFKDKVCINHLKVIPMSYFNGRYLYAIRVFADNIEVGYLEWEKQENPVVSHELSLTPIYTNNFKIYYIVGFGTGITSLFLTGTCRIRQ